MNKVEYESSCIQSHSYFLVSVRFSFQSILLSQTLLCFLFQLGQGYRNNSNHPSKISKIAACLYKKEDNFPGTFFSAKALENMLYLCKDFMTSVP